MLKCDAKAAFLRDMEETVLSNLVVIQPATDQTCIVVDGMNFVNK